MENNRTESRWINWSWNITSRSRVLPQSLKILQGLQFYRGSGRIFVYNSQAPIKNKVYIRIIFFYARLPPKQPLEVLYTRWETPCVIQVFDSSRARKNKKKKQIYGSFYLERGKSSQ